MALFLPNIFSFFFHAFKFDFSNRTFAKLPRFLLKALVYLIQFKALYETSAYIETIFLFKNIL